jgi:hypothetical protein
MYRLAHDVAKQWFIELIGGMEMDSGDAPHFLHAKEFAIEFIENTLEGGMTAFDPRRTLGE